MNFLVVNSNCTTGPIIPFETFSMLCESLFQKYSDMARPVAAKSEKLLAVS